MVTLLQGQIFAPVLCCCHFQRLILGYLDSPLFVIASSAAQHEFQYMPQFYAADATLLPFGQRISGYLGHPFEGCESLQPEGQRKQVQHVQSPPSQWLPGGASAAVQHTFKNVPQVQAADAIQYPLSVFAAT